jgi:hypothetical protein
MTPKEYSDKLMSGKLVYDIPFSIIESSATYFDAIIELIDSVYPSVRSVNIIGKHGIGKSTFARYWSYKKNINYIDSRIIRPLFLESIPVMDSVLKLVEDNYSDEPLIVDDSPFLSSNQRLIIQTNLMHKFIHVSPFPCSFSFPSELIILFSKDHSPLDDFYIKYPTRTEIPIIVVNPDYYFNDKKEVLIESIEQP